MNIDHVNTCSRHSIREQSPYYPGWFVLILSACLIFSPVHADNTPPSDATLEAKFTCSLQPVWNDKRSRADLDGFFYLPNVGPTEYLIGGYGNRNKTLLASDCVLTLSKSAYLAAPTGWELIWKDKGSGARLDGSMWRAVPPSEDYRCVGHVPQEGYDEPYIPNYRCVHAAFTEDLVTGELIWSDKGSGADKQVTMLHLPNTRSFVAVGARVEQLEAYDLRVDHSTATGDVVVVQAGGSDSPAGEVATPEPADEEAGGAAITESTDKKASAATVTESADVEAESGQPFNTGDAKAQADAPDSEAARLRAAAEAALAEEDFDQAADYLARLRALRLEADASAKGGREPATARPAQADSNTPEPSDQTAAQADTGVTQPGNDTPIESDTSISEAGDEPSVATDTGFSEISEETSVTTDAGVPESNEDAPVATDTSISEAEEQTLLTAGTDAPEASDTAPAQTGADTGDVTADDEPLAQTGSYTPHADFSGSGPDLTVDELYVSNDEPGINEPITLRARTWNQGDAQAAATTLRYYRSTDSVISSTDTALGTKSVSALDDSTGLSRTIDLTTPSNSGVYYYGACVDPVSNESNTGNNCSVGIRVEVYAVVASPDLSISTPFVSSNRLSVGEAFTLRISVSNDGVGDSAPTTLRYYRSSDYRIGTDDTQVRTASLRSLRMGATSYEEVRLIAPSSPGAYYYGACADPVSNERDASDNCTPLGIRVEVSGDDSIGGADPTNPQDDGGADPTDPPRSASASTDDGADLTNPPGGTTRDDCPDCPEMVVIPGSSFHMGHLSGKGKGGESVHRVRVPAFRLGKYEVTFAHWDACVAGGGCGGYRPDDEGWGPGQPPGDKCVLGRCPVVHRLAERQDQRGLPFAE